MAMLPSTNLHKHPTSDNTDRLERGWDRPGGHRAGVLRGLIQITASELRRIFLLSTPVNKGRGMEFGRSLCSLAVNLWFLERTAAIVHSRLYGKCLRNSSLAPSDAKPS